VLLEDLAVCVPTTIRPLESNLTASTPPSAIAMVSAAGKNIPVLLSPVGLMDGALALPAAKVETPDTKRQKHLTN
jgi:hypothetical protein